MRKLIIKLAVNDSIVKYDDCQHFEIKKEIPQFCANIWEDAADCCLWLGQCVVCQVWWFDGMCIVYADTIRVV